MGSADNNPFSLTGKTVLVTGASSGIGRATAIECLRMGAEVILSAIPGEVGLLQRVLDEMDGCGHAVVPADLKEEEEIRALAMDVSSMDGFFRQCAIELANRNIRSNIINPGVIQTKKPASIFVIERF